MKYLGDFPTGATIPVYFGTYDKDDGSSITLTGLAVTDIEIYKNGSATQRASDAGYTLLDTDGIDFDGITGIHGFSIDTSDNTDAGFYAAGNEYAVVVSAVTVDTVNISFVAATFSIERSGGALALLKHADYGLAKLVRSATPANALAINASGEASADVTKISGDGTAADNLELDYDGTGYNKANSTIGTCTTNTDMRGTDGAATAGNLATVAAYVDTEVASILAAIVDATSGLAALNTDLDTLLSRLTAARAGYLDNLNGHVPQTGDSFAIVNHGTYGNSALNTKLGSPAATIAADIASIKVDTGTTIINHLTGIKGATFDTATDSLEALRNRGDSAWATATGFSTHSAADVWAVGTRALSDKAGFSLSAAGVDAILDEVVEGSSTLRQLVRIMAAVLAGKSAGGGTAEIIFTGIDGTTARVTATVDANGNRTAMVLNGA